MGPIRGLFRGEAGSSTGGSGAMTQHTVGNALVLHREELISPAAQSLALAVVEDPENDVVILDLDEHLPVGSWQSMAGVIPRRYRRGIRLMTCGGQRGSAVMAGQWLSERLNRTVVAPDGELVRGPAGVLFVHSRSDSGWVRFRPGRPPVWDAKRYPAPAWDAAAAQYRPSSAACGIEPLPGGVWLHDVRPSRGVAEHRRRLFADVPCQPETMTVLLGCPGTPALPLDDVVRFWRALDADSRRRVRFVRYGDVRIDAGEPFGQALADLLESRIVCYTGVPVGAPGRFEVRTIRSNGALGWPPFALELCYEPRAHRNSRAARPAVLSHREPLAAAEELSPRVYWYAPDAVAEVVEAGLWVRATQEPANAERVRATPLDPEGATLVFDDSVPERAPRMRELVEDLAARLDHGVGQDGTVRPASILAPDLKTNGAATATLRYLTGIHPELPQGEPTVAAPYPTPIGTAPVAIPPPLAPPTAPEQPSTLDQAALPSSAKPGPMALPAAPAPPLPPPAEPLMSLAAGPVVSLPLKPIVRQPATPTPPPPAAPDMPPSADPDVPPPTSPVRPPSAGKVMAALAGPSPVVSAPPAPAVPPPAEPARSPLSPLSGTVVSPPVGPVAPDIPIESSIDEPAGKPVGPVAPVSPAPVRSVMAETVVGVMEQPVPAGKASALVGSRGPVEERAWLRRSLSRDFDTLASSVSRLMSEHPGMKAGGASSAEDVLVDSVAIRLYLTRRGAGIDEGLRSGKGGPHVPFARCAVSGLSRLPSFRGTTVVRATPSAEEWAFYRSRKLVTDWGFVNMLAAPCSGQRGTADVLIWSMTARRTALLEPNGDEHVDDRVVYLPGTHFKVLAVEEPEGDRPGAILLREIGATEIDDDGRVDPNRVSLDGLALASLRRSAGRWSGAEGRQRIGAASVGRFGLLPGLIGAAGGGTSVGEEEVAS